MRTNGSFPALIFVVIAGIGAVLGFSMHAAGYEYLAFIVFGIAIFAAAIVSSAIRVADQWSKAVVLRLGKFRALEGPGLFFIIPLIDAIPYWIDTRVLTSSFKAEKTLTKDTVPASFCIEEGNDIVGILMRVIKRENTDMLVISTHGMSGWHPLIFGSIAEQVIKQVNCSLLLLQSGRPVFAAKEHTHVRSDRGRSRDAEHPSRRLRVHSRTTHFTRIADERRTLVV